MTQPRYEYFVVSAPLAVDIFAAICQGIAAKYSDAMVLSDHTADDVPPEWQVLLNSGNGDWFLMRVDLNTRKDDDD